MTGLVKAVHTVHYFAEALSWGAIAYAAFLLFGEGWLGVLCAVLALVVTVTVWSLFASARAFFRTPIGIVASRVVLYALAVGGLIAAGLLWVGVGLGVVLVAAEGFLIVTKNHRALYPHVGTPARVVAAGAGGGAESAPASEGTYATRKEAKLAREAATTSAMKKKNPTTSGEVKRATIVGTNPRNRKRK